MSKIEKHSSMHSRDTDMLLLFVDVGVSQKMTEKNKEIHSHKKCFVK